MPNKPKKPCTKCRRNLTTERFCDDCKTKVKRREKATRQQYDKRRGTAAERGYNAKWRKERKLYLSEPDNQLCAICLKDGKVTASECIDHIIPHKGDKNLFWDINNWQPSCLKCNTKKAIREEGALAR